MALVNVDDIYHVIVYFNSKRYWSILSSLPLNFLIIIIFLKSNSSMKMVIYENLNKISWQWQPIIALNIH